MSDAADALRYLVASDPPEPEPAIQLYVPYVGWFQLEGAAWTKIPRPIDWRRRGAARPHESRDYAGYREDR